MGSGQYKHMLDTFSICLLFTPMRIAIISLALLASAAAFAPRRAVASAGCPDAIKALATCAKQASTGCACVPEYDAAINACSSTPATSDALIDFNIEVQNLENVPSGIFTDDLNAIFAYTNRCPRKSLCVSWADCSLSASCSAALRCYFICLVYYLYDLRWLLPA